MKILCCGSRYWLNYQYVLDTLTEFKDQDTTIIHGACRGADRMSGRAARELGFRIVEFPADWATYGRAGGPIRNRVMLDQEPDLVIAFHVDLSQSRGTADTVREAERRGIPVRVLK